MHLIISGAGPAGLTAAVTAVRRGMDVTVLEKHPLDSLYRDVGGAYDIYPTAQEVFRRLDLEEPMKHAADQIRVLDIVGAAGRRIRTIELPKNHFWALIRSEMQRVLLEALGDGHLHCDREVTGYEVRAELVEVRTRSGEEYTGDLLLGADGVYSAVREGLLGKTEPRYSGVTSWWGRIDTRGVEGFGDVELDRATMLIAPGLSYAGGHSERRGDSMWAAFKRMPARSGASDHKAEALEELSTLPAGLIRYIEHTEPSRVSRARIQDRDPAARWTEDRVALIGDAAHAMTPFLGLGCNSSVCDAYLLVQLLSTADTIGAALEEYEARRKPWLDRKVLQARKQCDRFLTDNRLASWLMRTMIRFMPTSLFISEARGYDAGNDIGPA